MHNSIKNQAVEVLSLGDFYFIFSGKCATVDPSNYEQCMPCSITNYEVD